ncbi:hypothetical protein B0H14DRAFT_3144093 [Mycena olivaceomarginata]|nr:hypothetical protein B0H14DRAFT_3144093 [Mycena olivaceomarginata]
MYNVSVRGEEKKQIREERARGRRVASSEAKEAPDQRATECGHHNCTRTSVPEGGLTKDGGRGASREAVVSVEASGGQGTAGTAGTAGVARCGGQQREHRYGQRERRARRGDGKRVGGGIGRGSTRQQTRTRLFRQSCPGKISGRTFFAEKAVPSMLSRWDAETHATTLRGMLAPFGRTILGATGANTQGASPIEAGERQERQRPDEGGLRARNRKEQRHMGTIGWGKI